LPHMCTRCKSAFEDGADLLKGCPNCGWKKFIFIKKGKAPARLEAKADLKGDAKGMDDVKVASVSKVELKKSSPRDSLESQPEGAKVNVKSRGKAAPDPQEAETGGTNVESIKITAPGTYELNLPTLFERDELIMAVKEGTYLIDLSSAFRKKKE
jgi:predicted  nucleic acid-binding Zn-ribbon protein